MSDPPKGQPGLFRLKDLEAMELDEQPLFPSSEVEPGGLISEVAAEEMVAAIRRARDLHSQEHEPKDLSPEVSGIYSLLVMDSLPGQGDATAEEDDETGEHDIAEAVRAEVAEARQAAEGAGDDGAAPDLATQERSYRTAQSHAVIQAAQAERTKRTRGAVLFMVGLPLLLVAITATVLVLVLTSKPGMSDEEFPVRAVAVSGPTSELDGVDLMAIPEPPPEPEVAPEPEPRPERRHHREREPEPVIDRGDLF